MINEALTEDNNVDWHIWLAANPLDPKKSSVVVETTPRVRKNHPKWSATKLLQFVAKTKTKQTKVRTSGWLMFDPDHPDELPAGKHPTRSTLWEIHPVTKIEVSESGAWKDADNI